MTKKVLISLDEIKGLFKACVDVDYAECWADYRDIVNQDFIDDWFDAQPAVSGVVYTESSDMASEFLALSKMKTTGVKNDD